MTRTIPEPEKRKPLNMSQKIAVFARDALCPKCFKPFAGKVEFDHIHALDQGGAHAVENIQPLCVACHKDKSRADQKRSAKNRRLREETGQTKRRKARGGSSIQSRGFQKPPDGYRYNWSK